MTRIFAPGPHRNIPDATAAVQQLEQLLAEAGELRDRIASACTGTAACTTHWPGLRRADRVKPQRGADGRRNQLIRRTDWSSYLC